MHVANQLAWELYIQTINLSPQDSRGLPTITMLLELIKMRELELDIDEVNEMLRKIMIIHNNVIEYYSEKLRLANRQ